MAWAGATGVRDRQQLTRMWACLSGRRVRQRRATGQAAAADQAADGRVRATGAGRRARPAGAQRATRQGRRRRGGGPGGGGGHALRLPDHGGAGSDRRPARPHHVATSVDVFGVFWSDSLIVLLLSVVVGRTHGRGAGGAGQTGGGQRTGAARRRALGAEPQGGAAAAAAAAALQRRRGAAAGRALRQSAPRPHQVGRFVSVFFFLLQNPLALFFVFLFAAAVPARRSPAGAGSRPDGPATCTACCGCAFRRRRLDSSFFVVE